MCWRINYYEIIKFYGDCIKIGGYFYGSTIDCFQGSLGPSASFLNFLKTDIKTSHSIFICCFSFQILEYIYIKMRTRNTRICFFCRKMKIQESGLTVHKFPLNDQYLLKQWLNNIPIKNWGPTKLTVLCSNHFAEDCFKISKEGKLLKPNSIPTRFASPQAYCIYCKRKRIYESRNSFFKFPLHKSDILKKWLDNMGIKNWIPNNSSLLCSEHFEESCFERKKKGRKLWLKEKSVPTIFKTECLSDIKSAVLTSIESSTDDVQLDIAQLDTTQSDTDQLNTVQLETDQLNTVQLDTDQLDTDQLDTVQLDADQLDTDQLNTDQLDTDQLNTIQLDTVELNMIHLDTAQLDTAQSDAAQSDTAQLDTAQSDTAQSDTTQLNTAQLDTAQLDTSQSRDSGKPLNTDHYGWYPIETWSVGILPSSITVDNGNSLGTYDWYPIQACSIGILPPSTTGFLQ